MILTNFVQCKRLTQQATMDGQQKIICQYNYQTKSKLPFFNCAQIHEGLNGVNRQPSNDQNINRQTSKTEYFYRPSANERAKISRQISFLIFFIKFFNFLILLIFF